MTNKAVKISVILLITATIIYPPYVQAGGLNIFGWIKSGSGVDNLQNKVLAGNTVATAEDALAYPEPNINNISLLQAVNNPEPSKKETASSLAMIDGSSFTNENNSLDGSLEEEEETSDQISLYTVRNGDTVSSVAKMFGVTPNTIYWANDLKAGSALKPEQVIVILPVSGIKYIVKKGDNVNLLAKKYKVDVSEIIDFNNIDVSIGLTVGQEIIIPNATVEVVKTKPATTKCKTKKCLGTTADDGSSKSKLDTTGYFKRPVNGGVRTQGLHDRYAIDIASLFGAPILASAGGEVLLSKSGSWNGGYGNYIVIKHPNGTQTLYGHLSETLVRAGDHVSKGQQIGKMGSTGRSTGVHLHFEIRGAKNPF